MNELIKQLAGLQKHIERLCYAAVIWQSQHYAEHIAELTAQQDIIIDQLHRDYHKSDENIRYEVSKV